MPSVISQEVYEAGSHLLTVRVKTVLSFPAELGSLISLIALLFPVDKLVRILWHDFRVQIVLEEVGQQSSLDSRKGKPNQLIRLFYRGRMLRG